MNDRLKTLHVDTALTWRGGEQQVVYLTTGLIARGHVAEIVCQPGSALAERAAGAGVPVHAVRMRGEWDVLGALRVSRLLARGGYDIVHSHTSHAHVVAGLASWMTRKRPVRVVARRVDFRIDGSVLSRMKYRRWAERYIAVSEAVKRVMVDGGVPAGKVRVVNSSVDLARFEDVEVGDLRGELGLPGDAVLIVDAAMLVEHKAQKYLVAAMPEVLAAYPRAYCLLVGDGKLRPELERQAAELGLEERVVFVGFRADALRFIKGADVSVMSSQEDGMGNSVQETLALKRPLVATNAGGIPEMAYDGVNAIVVERKDPGALAEGIIRMLGDPELQRRLGEEGRRTIEEKFTTDRMVERTLGVYHELLGKAGPA
jgi:glycosyltransferase involved in cell wall biosynthesis